MRYVGETLMSLATAIFLWILFLDTALITLVVDQDTPSEESPDCCSALGQRQVFEQTAL